MALKQLLLVSVAALGLGITACGPAATSDMTPATTQSAAVDFKLDYEKFTLDNGLEVILHVDRSDPIVAVTTVIHAGSNREKPGRTGFAHFFEHMAFNDSENVPRGWNRKAIPEWGGSRNGGTWSDGTIYYEVVPKDAFDKILWIDSDRLGYMINTVTQDALDREKQVVKNEKRQRVDNAPYGYTGEVIRTALYPEGHPYSWTVIGSLPDLQAATLEDLKEFHTENYGPNNATLSIVGDIDIAETKRKVQQWFGEIPRGKDIEPLPPMPVTLTADKRLYFEDDFAKLPELRLIMPTVEDYHPDAQALEVLAEILAGGKNAPLYKQIVEVDGLAPSVSAYNSAMEIAGEFVFRVRAKAGVDLDAVESSLRTALDNFEASGIDPNDLTRIKAEQETRIYSGLSTVLGKGRQLAQANEFAGDPAVIIKEAAALQRLTADDLMRVYNQYVKDKPAVITSFVPKGQAALAVEGASLATVWIEEVKPLDSSETVSAGAVAEYTKTPTKFDRSEPPFGELPLIKMPDIWTGNVGDVPVLGIENSEAPLVVFDVTLGGGLWVEPVEKAGALSLLTDLMGEGTASKTPAEFEQAAGLLGAYINVSNTREETRITVTTLARNVAPTVALLREVLMEPRFEQAEFDRVKSASLTSIKGAQARATTIAGEVFNHLIYGPEHPFGRPFSGSEQSVSGLSLDDVKAAHTRLLAGGATIHIVGDISAEQAKAALAPLSEGLSGKGALAPKSSIFDQGNAGKVFFVDVPDAKQSVITIGKLTLATMDDEANKLDFVNEKLGGGISGDLAQVLRIEKGYTYGASSGVSGGTVAQPFRARTSVRANATQPSLEVMRDMIINHGPSFDDAAVEMTQQKLLKSKARAFESLNAKLGTLREISKYGKSKRFVEEEQDELLNMRLADFKAVAARHLDEAQMTYVIVGDKATQLAPVQAFAQASGKGAVTELDIFGNPVN